MRACHKLNSRRGAVVYKNPCVCGQYVKCSRCRGTGYCGLAGDTCDTCEGSGARERYCKSCDDDYCEDCCSSREQCVCGVVDEPPRSNPGAKRIKLDSQKYECPHCKQEFVKFGWYQPDAGTVQVYCSPGCLVESLKPRSNPYYRNRF